MHVVVAVAVLAGVDSLVLPVALAVVAVGTIEALCDGSAPARDIVRSKDVLASSAKGGARCCSRDQSPPRVRVEMPLFLLTYRFHRP